MADKLWFLLPEIWLFIGVVVLSIIGLSKAKALRDSLPFVTCFFLIVAFIMTPFVYSADRVADAPLLLPMLGKYVKMIVCAVGTMLALLSVGLLDRPLEVAMAEGRTRFDAIRVNRGEYFAFFLLSLIGVMLVCNANDLIWLFLALELASLPTYIMVAISRPSSKAQEAAVKYFFLGAMSSAMFLYGFAMLYGSTGTIVITELRDAFTSQTLSGGLNRLAIVGMILTILGLCFKIVAVPMHFYAADVYEGAASPVTAFLGFVPKTAGAVALILLLSTIGWSDHHGFNVNGLPREILTTLWMVAVLTMTLGNVGALLQRSAKRMLAYSSIAHSGYLIIGLIAGPPFGLNAVLFYLLAYGVMNTAAFAVLAAFERRGQEIESLDDLAGLRRRYPVMAVAMAIAAGSLMGMPPLLGFAAKLYLFVAGMNAGHVALIVIAGLNSAISAFYYLKLVALPILAQSTPQSETVIPRPVVWPRVAAVVTASAIIILPIFANQLMDASNVANSKDQSSLTSVTDDLSLAEKAEEGTRH